MADVLASIRRNIPVCGAFRTRSYDEGFTIVISAFIGFILLEWFRRVSSSIEPMKRKSNRCHFCESTNVNAILDPSTDVCQSCGQLNAFDDEGDYARPIPELYHPQMNKKCGTPVAMRGLPTVGSPQPKTAPANVLCPRCVINQEKIVATKATFVPSRGGDAVFAREYAAFERQLEQEYPLCPSCQLRVKQFVVEQDRQIAATVASTATTTTQNRLFMAKNGVSSKEESEVFVPAQRIYRRNKVLSMLTMISVAIPLFWGPFDVTGFWWLRVLSDFFALVLGFLSAVTSPHFRMPWTILTIIGLAVVVVIDFLAVFLYLDFILVEDVVRYNLQIISRNLSSLIQFFPFVVSFFAFANTISLLPSDKTRKSAAAYYRQSSVTTFNGSPTPSEPYVTSLLAETVDNGGLRRRSTPWKATFSSTKSVYTQNYSPISNQSSFSPTPKRRGRFVESGLITHLLLALGALGLLVAYVFFVM